MVDEKRVQTCAAQQDSMNLVLTGSEKNPYVTKVALTGSRKLLQPHMLILKSVKFVLMAHRINRTGRKIMPGCMCLTGQE